MKELLQPVGTVIILICIILGIIYIFEQDKLNNEEKQNKIKTECNGYLTQYTNTYGELEYQCFQNEYAYCKNTCRNDCGENTCVEACLKNNKNK